MNEQTEKSFNRLKSIVLNDAHEHGETIAHEYEEKTNSLLTKTDREYSVMAEKRKKTAVAKAEREAHASVLKAEQEARRELSAYREELADDVFAYAREKINEFMRTDEYKNWLLATAERALSECEEGERTLEVNADDAHLLADFDAEVRIAEKIGGLRAVNHTKGIIADYSVDGMLEEEREVFLNNCGLKIEI